MLEYREPDPKHTVEYVEFLLLPQWVDECPWCKELEYLESRVGEMSGSSIPRIILDRVELLRGGKVDGMTDDLFIRLDSDLEMTIGEHSLFLREPCSEADILAAVASAIQRLRTRVESDAQALTPWRHPIAPVLDSVEYLQKVFKSSVLRAAFSGRHIITKLSMLDRISRKNDGNIFERLCLTPIRTGLILLLRCFTILRLANYPIST